MILNEKCIKSLEITNKRAWENKELIQLLESIKLLDSKGYIVE